MPHLILPDNKMDNNKRSSKNGLIRDQDKGNGQPPRWLKRSQSDVVLRLDDRYLDAGIHDRHHDLEDHCQHFGSNDSNTVVTNRPTSEELKTKNAHWRSLPMSSELETYLHSQSRQKGRSGAFSKALHAANGPSSKSGPINRPHTSKPSLHDRQKQMLRNPPVKQPDENVFHQQNRTYKLAARAKTILQDGILKRAWCGRVLCICTMCFCLYLELTWSLRL